ncbi:glycosyl hydrolase 108 family protein [Dongia deserti]|uniref:glycosyl hydrolase 108 family protein n=1 Tax=Dongia deserti TaxID=2268030 RepID=UPI000E64C10C|nr:glycosyl hydrolase 108 family protein [Dongia deserti]
MYSSDFTRAVAIVLKAEGVFSDDKRDPGGETKYGISKRWHPGEDIPNLTIDRATEIYHEHYWLKFSCDELPWPWSLLVFDGVVNQPAAIPGPEDGVIEMLQDTVGVKDDGIVGPVTIAAARKRNTPADWGDFLSRRAWRYAQKSHQDLQRGLFLRLFKLQWIALRTFEGKEV